VTLDKTLSIKWLGWEWGITVAAGSLSIGIFWEGGVTLRLPCVRLWVETDDSYTWQWCWQLYRMSIWKTEFRLECGLNDWAVGIECFEFNDFSLHCGPFSIEIETDKGFAHDDEIPIIRFFVPPRTYIHPYPIRCRCCPPKNRLQCDDVTDFADD